MHIFSLSVRLRALVKNPGNPLRSPGVEENRLLCIFILNYIQSPFKKKVFYDARHVLVSGLFYEIFYTYSMYYARSDSFSFILVQVAVFQCHSLTETYIK
jgi:hypothetical protein